MGTTIQTDFVYSRPVSGFEFIGRRKEVSILASNLVNGTSTALHGAPGSGRTSLLRFFEHRENLYPIIGEAADQFCSVFLDLETTNHGRRFDPKDFWQTVLKSLQSDHDDPQFQKIRTEKTTAEDEKVRLILEHFSRSNRSLVLLIDNFSLLFDERTHSQDELPDHLHLRLRSFATQYPLVIFCATDRFLTELDDSNGIWFSPLINIFQERACPGFSRADLDEFNSRIIAESGRTFSTTDLDFIHQLTFGFPILCQISADKLCGHRQKLGWEHLLTDDQRESIFDETYLAAQQALARIWTSLTADERIILMYILLAHRGGKEVNNITYKISKNDPELFGFRGWRVNRLIQFQLVMQNRTHDRYEITSPLLERFVADQVRSKQYPELEDRETRFLVFSQALFDRFKKVVTDHEAVFIQISAKLFENWMSED